MYIICKLTQGLCDKHRFFIYLFIYFGYSFVFYQEMVNLLLFMALLLPVWECLDITLYFHYILIVKSQQNLNSYLMSGVNTDIVCSSACYIKRYFEIFFFFFSCTTVFKQIVFYF